MHIYVLDSFLTQQFLQLQLPVRFLQLPFAKVSKGNWRSFMQVKLRDTGTGSIIEQRFRVDDELQQAFLDQLGDAE